MLLVTATDLEMQALTAACVPARLPEQRLVCGVGPAEAAFRLGLFLAAAGASGQLPDCVLNIGIAGAYLHPGLPAPAVLDCCLATSEVLGDLGKCQHGRLLPLQSGCHDFFPLDAALGSRIRSRLEEAGFPVETGPFVTVSCASGDRDRADLLLARYPDALCENMEGAALALAAAHFGLPFAELRCVSNVVDEPERQHWCLQAACARCGEVAALLFEEKHTWIP
ncbi:futalosine hydrolase [Desulfobulbus oralis]|uniref:Futalosine hydrolase n=1 Tax=Desulfobulbus oralis TaxID=1986146 RepID=A0A2L1GP13_9BACT|nr:futalosine hydrolase [Desulfobulbus oralis]AVD71420.1 futalosine hydrolase [Desulfobulbus oralis]